MDNLRKAGYQSWSSRHTATNTKLTHCWNLLCTKTFTGGDGVVLVMWDETSSLRANDHNRWIKIQQRIRWTKQFRTRNEGTATLQDSLLWRTSGPPAQLSHSLFGRNAILQHSLKHGRSIPPVSDSSTQTPRGRTRKHLIVSVTCVVVAVCPASEQNSPCC